MFSNGHFWKATSACTVCGPGLFLSTRPLGLTKRPTSFLFCVRADKDDEAEQPVCAARAALLESLSHLPELLLLVHIHDEREATFVQNCKAQEA